MPTLPTTLVVRHIPNTDPPQFTVERLSDGKASPPVSVPPPNSVPVKDRPNDPLTGELRWYLEEFLSYPFPPETDHADRVQQAMQAWGQQAFTALFTHPHARRCYEKAVEGGFANLTLRVVSDSPIILGWPWEALHDPETGRLAHHCEIERRIDDVRGPPALGELPRDRVNVLLVIARPYEGDVKYRSIARPVVELARKQNLPVSVHVLRPPTFGQLREHLRTHPNHYHILHFDGHGAYRPGAPVPGGGNVLLKAREGRLVFEKEDGTADPIEAGRLTELLREHAVPVVVLNACQSAAVDEHAADPFASVAAALLKAGMRSVVAMAYALYVSGAQQFLPAFYGRLFETGSLAGAVRAGRQQMLQLPERVCSRGTYPLEDWVVPVVYQQDPLDFSFVTQAAAPQPAESRLPDEARDERNPYGFIGRDGALLALERALHRAPAGVVVTGLGGVGKTTLARGFLKWLEQTNGLGVGAVWFDFRTIHAAEYVLNRLGEALFNKPEFATLPVAKKLDILAEACKQTRLLIVWDNFESAKGIPGTAVAAILSSADAQLLKDLLARLRGGQTRVLITSRSPEEWLGPTNIGKPIALGGLDGEERWEFANTIVRDLGLKLDRKDPALSKLMDSLKGHPLAMRVVLSKLQTMTAEQLTTGLRANFTQLLATTSDETEAMLFATLRVATDALPEEWKPLLIPLGLHEGYAATDVLEVMAETGDATVTRAMIDSCFAALENAGLVRVVTLGNYELHPLLTSYLRSAQAAQPSTVRETWTRAFVGIMGHLAYQLAPLRLHEQRIPFLLHEASFHTARAMAEHLGMNKDYGALTQSLAVYAEHTHNYPLAQIFYDQLQAHYEKIGNEEGRSVSLHQLGIIAHLRRDFALAEQLYRKSLEIVERLGDERGAAANYHQLGMVARERRDLAAAEQWYRKALEVFERLKIDHDAAKTYHQLGMVAEDRQDFAAAEQSYHKSLEIEERLGDDHGAGAYYQLGNVALRGNDLTAAEQCYGKSLKIAERLGIEHGTAMIYHQLGIVALKRWDLALAEQWYRKSLDIDERLGDEHGAAKTYYQLGRVAQVRRDMALAEQWYRKSLDIKERQGNERGAADTYHQLGIVAEERQDFEAAWSMFLKAQALFERFEDPHNSEMVLESLVRTIRNAPLDLRLKWFRALGQQAGLPEDLIRQIESLASAPGQGWATPDLLGDLIRQIIESLAFAPPTGS
jgi:tetratricopeptide (TPR) repeat protein